MPRTDLPPPLSLPRAVFLHLAPGVLLLAFYLLATPWLRKLGVPSAFALQVGLLVLVLPWMGAVLLRARRSEADVVPFRRPLSGWRYVVLGGGLFVWAVLVFATLGPWEYRLLANAFAWLPDWFWLNEDLSRYGRPALLTTWVLALVANGLALPVVEELSSGATSSPACPAAGSSPSARTWCCSPCTTCSRRGRT